MITVAGETPRGSSLTLPGLDWLCHGRGRVELEFTWQPENRGTLYPLLGSTLTSAHAGLSVWIEDRPGEGTAALRVYLTRGEPQVSNDLRTRDLVITPGKRHGVSLQLGHGRIRVYLDGVCVGAQDLIAPPLGGLTSRVTVGRVGAYESESDVRFRVELERPILGGDNRPQPIVDLPPDYGTRAHPVVVFLHGHGGHATDVRKAHSRLLPLADAASTIVVWAQASAPTRNGTPAWRGTSACCWVGANPPDDEAYVRQLVLDLVEHYRVDPARLFLWGSSNGAFLAHACAVSCGDILAGVVAWKGMTHVETELHTPVAPVRLLHAHGTADEAVDYHGGGPWHPQLAAYPSVQEGLDRWRQTNACIGEETGDTWVGTDAGQVVSETVYPGPHEVRRWDVEGADHAIYWASESYARALDWLLGGAP